MFLSVEGIDGAGKSTQARRLAARLAESGREVVTTREPGGARGAEAIRALLVTGDPARWSPEAELLLFTAARRDHLERTIAPALARDAVVVCDRFADSTRAYQAAARDGGDGVARDLIERLHRDFIGIEPDLTLIFDIDPSRARARARDAAEDRFERLGASFQAALRDGFRALAAEDPARRRLIDAGRDEDAVAADVWAAVAPALGHG